MQNDCEIYLDPEEDEVFFGCMSEKEKNLCDKLVKYAGSDLKDEYESNKTLVEYKVLSVEENIENIPNNEQSVKISKEISKNDSTDFVTAHNELNNSLEKDQSASQILSINTSVELEHNYSSSMKPKIDKSILATPKSIVKADKDGGFLKVLSEIALVKAEAEGDNSEAGKENENKENKMFYPIPEIKITEATPDKGCCVLSPPKSAKIELRRFRNIHNSPRNENNVDYKSKSGVESFENQKNFKNKCSGQDIDKVFSDDGKRKSIDLINLNDSESDVLNVSILLDDEETEAYSKNENDVIILQDQIKMLSEPFKPDVGDLEPPSKSESQFSEPPSKVSNPSVSLRFSKEARKIVEVLKKSTVDDTLNFTIPEINIEEEENSFLSPRTPSAFDETVVSKNDVEIPSEKSCRKILTKTADEKPEMKCRTVEKYLPKLTPVVSKSKLQPMKFFSEGRIYNRNESEMKKRCAKKLPLEERKAAMADKVKGVKACESETIPLSRIPVFGAKNSKIPINERIARPFTSTTPKASSGKSSKNPKFNHIESPINAYIHNKPTSLVCNVKPEIKKDSLTKVLKAQTVGSANTMIQEKPRKQNSNSTIKLPFVEYQSATPYKIEKRSESRLPRLAPTVIKLIGSHSPKVLRHEGRFYMNKPKKPSSAEATIVAEPNEVSVVLSQPAQKSNTIK